MKLPILVLALAMTSPVIAQTDPAAYQAETDRIKAETARLEAQTKLLKAEQEKRVADDPDVTSAAKEKALADLRKANAEANKAAADADKAALAATIPEFKTELAKGAITADDNAGYFVRVLGHDALRAVAAKIAAALKTAIPASSKVYLVGTPDQLQTTGLRLLVKGKLSAYSDAFQNLKIAAPDGNEFQPETALGTLAAARGALGLAADIASFTRQDRDIKGRAIEVDSKLMMQAVAGAFLAENGSHDVTFVNPSAIIKTSQAGSTVIGLFEQLENSYVELVALKDKVGKHIETQKVKLAEVEEELAQLKNAAPLTNEQKEKLSTLGRDKLRIEGNIRMANNYLETSKSILGSYRTFADSLLVIAQGKSESLLTSVFGNDLIASEANTVHLLEVTVSTIGGEMELRKWPWSSGKVHHRAGAVCHYALWADTGVLKASGLIGADIHATEGKKTELSILK